MKAMIGCEIVNAGTDPNGWPFLVLKGAQTGGREIQFWLQSDEEGNDGGVMMNEEWMNVIHTKLKGVGHGD